MRPNTALAALILTMPLALAASEVFTTGDRIFIRAQVLGCGGKIRTVGFADVEDAQPVTLFSDISLSVMGKSSGEVKTDIEDVIEEKIGRRPGSISVIRVPHDDHERASKLLLDLYYYRKHGCQRQHRRHLDEEFWLEVEYIAMQATTGPFVSLTAHLRNN